YPFTAIRESGKRPRKKASPHYGIWGKKLQNTTTSVNVTKLNKQQRRSNFGNVFSRPLAQGLPISEQMWPSYLRVISHVKEGSNNTTMFLYYHYFKILINPKHFLLVVKDDVYVKIDGLEAIQSHMESSIQPLHPLVKHANVGSFIMATKGITQT
ncbi:hypothetical protein ACJX0J_027237, partial [Zea mays]